MGTDYSDKFFHNVILKSGGMPIHYLKRLFDIRIQEMKKEL
ncbi:MAG: hypothetical protein ACW964_17110 [Candidatus Hodarchaeales archaeon]